LAVSSGEMRLSTMALIRTGSSLTRCAICPRDSSPRKAKGSERD